MEKYYNPILIGFILITIVLSVLWAFNTVRRIEVQKNYGARVLTEVAKLWRRAKFVPEDAKDRESLYLYRDFLRKFEGENCKYPLMLKNGGVRCMTRQEFEYFAQFKPVKPFSLLTTVASALVAVIALVVNIVITKTFWLGLILLLILPFVQVLLMFFLKKLIKEKDIYRDGLFMALKENCINFVSITKPFIVVDAYPDKFGKNAEPIYIAKGEPNLEQIREIKNFIANQRNLDRSATMTNPIPVISQEVAINNELPVNHETPTNHEFAENHVLPESPQPAVTDVTPVAEPVAENIAPVDEVNANNEELPILSTEESEVLLKDVINDILIAKIDQKILEQKNAEAATAAVVEEKETAPAEEVAPAEDDFSLEAIGRALDAEIAKRNAKK